LEQPYGGWVGSDDLTITNTVNLTKANLYLSWANLTGANLSFVNLSLADLRRANLSEANLSGTNLSGADLFWADLSGTNLHWADLSGANLYWADLSGANLSRAILQYARLSEADFSDADLTGCRVYGVSAWSLKLEGTKQQNLVIHVVTSPISPSTTLRSRSSCTSCLTTRRSVTQSTPLLPRWS